jgi:hypothetical protein
MGSIDCPMVAIMATLDVLCYRSSISLDLTGLAVPGCKNCRQEAKDRPS